MKKLSIIALLATTIYGATPEQPGADAVPSITNGQHNDLAALTQLLFTDNMSAEGKLQGNCMKSEWLSYFFLCSELLHGMKDSIAP